jgi:hypothetical protein
VPWSYVEEHPLTVAYNIDKFNKLQLARYSLCSRTSNKFHCIVQLRLTSSYI